MSDQFFQGQGQGQGQGPPYPPQQPQYGYPQYPGYDVPPEIRKWNWGAFMFNMYWGIGNQTWIALLCLIPCFGIVFAFVLGAKGNEWAWRAGNYQNLEMFWAVQRTWNRAGFVYFWIFVSIFALYLLILVPILIISSAAYRW